MIIKRWQADNLPTLEQLKIFLSTEGLDPYEELLAAGAKVIDHKHPFCEVRYVSKGEMQFNISGNRFVLREGDKLEIPANTKHSFTIPDTTDCICVCAQRAI